MPEQKWLPLESNPKVWDEIIRKLGADSAWSYEDVYGLDPELLAMIPRPVAALIFLFPLTEKYEEFRHEEDARLTKLEQNISSNVVFFKQTISNACGMIALLHSLANNPYGIVAPGPFLDFLNKAKSMSPDERAELLENSPELAEVHREAAHEGQTETPSLDEQINLHFVCFVQVDDHLYELDGRRSFPINHGRSEDLVTCAAKFMRQYMERDPDQTNFSIIALAKTDESS